ncbi:MAG: helix-turn-helix domain-containing protein [Raineya sp.]|jgi:AraC-like DNA-binding protein|nr:helix-turn-helix domain-containing protein [Raineya sp.]
MTIESFIPQNDFLKSLIRCIYIIENPIQEKKFSFLIFPSVSTYLSVSLGTTFSVKENTITTHFSDNQSLDSSVQLSLSKSYIYEYQGYTKEICILFKPLGIYSFFDEQYLWNNLNSFTPSDTFQDFFTEILMLENYENMITRIEDYFLSIYTPFSHKYLQEIISTLENIDDYQKINLIEIAHKYQITRQTLHNQFKKYIGLSPSQFKQIWKFRKFIDSKLADNTHAKLTDIVYDIGFFDQSHLIKYFKKFASLTPLDFFKKIQTSENKSVLLIWQQI